MNLGKWLLRVAAAVSAEPKPLTIEVYLDELSTWGLTDAQWDELSRRLIRSHRIPRCLPLLPDIADMASEIVQADVARAQPETLGEKCPPPPEVKAKMDALFREGR